jgi:DMSO/TMAO reductase YedYZ molybdopterin-dependent catalytic subunit
MNRREAIKAMPLLAALPKAKADAPGLTVRMSEPPNLEPPFSGQSAFLTPMDQFYVRNHFPTPAIKEEEFALEVSGAVEKPLKLSLKELKALPQVSRPITLECAGNGRVFLAPPVKGLQWQFGAVGTAEWGGVELKTLLDKAGVKPGAVEVILVGADKGTIAGDAPSPGAIHFDRSIPLKKAIAPETMLVHSMNGEPLTPAHGYPLRAVVGGWYGMAAVKWLTRIIVTDKPYDGFWQTFDYSFYERTDGGLATLKPLAGMLPKAQISRPAIGEAVVAGSKVTIRGMAWAGESTVAKVQVSTDGGLTWLAVPLDGEAVPFCWRLWSHEWSVPEKPGTAKLLARCYDAEGRGQPDKRDPDRRTYAINHLVPVEVAIRKGKSP